VDNPDVVKELDQLEGHQSGVRSGYHREIIPVILDDSNEVSAWIYVYYSDQPRGRLVESGDWLETLNVGRKLRR